MGTNFPSGQGRPFTQRAHADWATDSGNGDYCTGKPLKQLSDSWPVCNACMPHSFVPQSFTLPLPFLPFWVSQHFLQSSLDDFVVVPLLGGNALLLFLLLLLTLRLDLDCNQFPPGSFVPQSFTLPLPFLPFWVNQHFLQSPFAPRTATIKKHLCHDAVFVRHRGGIVLLLQLLLLLITLRLDLD